MYIVLGVVSKLIYTVKQVYSNDKKAPRMRKREFCKRVVSKDLYKKFIAEFPEYKEMTWVDFYQNWVDIAKHIRHEAIWNPLGVKMGSYIGELKLQYLPYKFQAVDPNSEDGSTFININSKGKVATVKWERRWAVKFNKILQFYGFSETRELNKMAFEYTTKHPDKLRIARNTLGGMSVWRQKMRKK